MTRDEVRRQLGEVLEDVLGRDDIEVRDQDAAEDVEGWDSLSHIRIMASVEREFGIRFSNAEIEKLQTAGDLIDQILAKVPA